MPKYRKSYYQRRREEQRRIKEAINKQVEPEAKPVEEPVVEEENVSLPDDSWKKDEIKAWLDENDIEYSRWDTKAKLLEKVNG